MKKILLVDEDEKTLSPFVKDLIETYQFEITWLKKADDVVETLKGTKFDIVILDVMMPIPEKWTPDEHRRAEHGFSTGTVLFQKIRQGFPDLPVLFYTAKGGILQMKNLGTLGSLNLTTVLLNL